MNKKRRTKKEDRDAFSALSEAERQYAEYLRISSIGEALVEANSFEKQTGYSSDWSHPMGLVINK